MLAFDHFVRPAHPSTSLRRSPLGAHDGNACSYRTGAVAGGASKPHSLTSNFSFPGNFSFNRMSSTNAENVGHPSQPKGRVAEPRRREGKFAPLLRRRDDRDQRRSAYISSSRRAGEDKLFEARAEQSTRRDFLDEQREWRAHMAAQFAHERPIDEEEEERMLEEEQARNPQHVEDDVDAMHDSEMMEPPSDDEDPYQYYLWSQAQPDGPEPQLPDLSQQHSQQDSSSTVTRLWSDDDEFEQSLLAIAMQAEQQALKDIFTQAPEQMDTDMATT